MNLTQKKQITHQAKMTEKGLRKIIQKLLLMYYVLKKWTYPGYISKHNLNYENQIFRLMIPNWEGWHYVAVERLSALLRISKLVGGSCYLKINLNLSNFRKYVKIKLF